MCVLDGFKYISCSYLSDWCGQKVAILPNSNTSHVLIYHKALSFMCVLDGFKYISCSYLSDWCGQKVAILPNSNTSHVLIYQIVK